MQIMRLPSGNMTWIIQIRNISISALKDLDHQVGIEDLEQVRIDDLDRVGIDYLDHDVSHVWKV